MGHLEFVHIADGLSPANLPLSHIFAIKILFLLSICFKTHSNIFRK